MILALQRGWLQLLLALLSGGLAGLLFPSLEVGLLGFVAYVPWLILVLVEDRPRRRFFIGWFFGAGLLITSTIWLEGLIVNYSPIPRIGAIGLLFLYAFGFGIKYALISSIIGRLRALTWLPWWVGVALVVVGVEWVFPDLYPYFSGAVAHANPYLVQSVDLAGVSLLTFVVILVNAALAQAIAGRLFRRPDMSRRHWLALVIVLVLVHGYGAWRHHAPIEPEDTLRVAMIQANNPMPKHSPVASQGEMNLPRRVDVLREQSEAALAEGDVEVLMWPEGGAFFSFDTGQSGQANPYGKLIHELAERGVYVIFNDIKRERRQEPDWAGRMTSIFNNARLVSPEGHVLSEYQKVMLLQFGEAIPRPFVWLLERVPALAEIVKGFGVGPFTAGNTDDNLNGFDVGHAVGMPLICYETLSPSFVTRFAGRIEPFDLFFVMSNDAWFTDGLQFHENQELKQHEALAVMRAIEWRRPMLRATNTGMTMAFDARGRPLSEPLPAHQPGFLVVDVPLANSFSMVQIWGNLWSWVALGLALALWALSILFSIRNRPTKR